MVLKPGATPNGPPGSRTFRPRYTSRSGLSKNTRSERIPRSRQRGLEVQSGAEALTRIFMSEVERLVREAAGVLSATIQRWSSAITLLRKNR